ncbi:MAG: VWA domain-containing protein [Phycisphaerales bacterium]
MMTGANGTTLPQAPARTPPAQTDPPVKHSPNTLRWHHRTQWVCLIASVAIHVLLFLSSLANVAVARVGSERGRDAADFELAVTSEAPLTIIDEVVLETAAPAVATPTELPDLATSGIMEGAGGFDAPGEGDGLGEIADGLGGAGGGDIGEGAGLGGGGGGSARFFGVEARGSRFAYVVDISGSMNYEGGRKLDELKRQLNASIGAMLEHMSFFIVAFNHEPHVVSGGKLAWVKATGEQKQIIADKVKALKADGGTNPLKSLEQVFRLGARPDAVYFMTDGVFDDPPSDVFAMLARVNRGARRVPIHCIGFGDAADEEVLRRIATDSGGSYRHVKGSR